MDKARVSWWSNALGRSLTVARWGREGTPVVLFPTAGGDAEECERMLMIRVLSPLIDAGRIHVWSVDHVAGWSWIDDEVPAPVKIDTQERYDRFIAHELGDLVARTAPGRLAIAAGYSLGGFQSLAAVCRHPERFRAGICMSSAYDLSPLVEGHHTEAFHHTSPMHFLPYLHDESRLAPLRERFLLLVHGRGRVEKPWRGYEVAKVLGDKGIPNRVDVWPETHDHDWVAWRDQLPGYLDQLA